jgi:hypothetical protein
MAETVWLAVRMPADRLSLLLLIGRVGEEQPR